MTNEEILNDILCRKYEEEWFEFKSNHLSPKDLGEYISAIANVTQTVGRKMGYLIFGVDDETHEILGTKFNYNISVKGEPLQNYLARNLKPSLPFTFEELEYEGKRLVILKIPSANDIPVSFDKERFFRIGSSKVNLINYPEREAFLWHSLIYGYQTMMNTPSPRQDLTFNELFDYYEKKGLNLNKDNFKVNLELLTVDGQYNMLACFLADNGHMSVRVSVFSGKDKASPLLSVREFGDEHSLISSVDRIIEYSEILNIPLAIMNNHHATRTDIPLFNQQCFNEALINAFINNRWTSTIGPAVYFYSDRVEITTYSGLSPDQTLEGFYRGESHPVNEALARIYIAIDLSERSGRGVPMIVREFGKEVYDIQDKFVKIRIPYNWDKEEMMGGSIPEYKLENNTIDLTNTDKLILKEIQKDNNITFVQIIERASRSRNTVQKSITKMRKLGVLVRIGSNKTGHWEVHYNKPLD